MHAKILLNKRKLFTYLNINISFFFGFSHQIYIFTGYFTIKND